MTKCWVGMLRRVAVVSTAALLFAGVASAQEATTGAIEGQVVDSQGLPIPGVSVTVTGAQGAKTFVTDADGRFLAAFLTPGVHKVKIELQGFKVVTIEDVSLPLGQRASLPPITLRLEGVTETLEVTGRPPTVDTSSSSTGANLQGDFLQRLPTQRHISDVVQLAAGVADSGAPAKRTPRSAALAVSRTSTSSTAST